MSVSSENLKLYESTEWQVKKHKGTFILAKHIYKHRERQQFISNLERESTGFFFSDFPLGLTYSSTTLHLDTIGGCFWPMIHHSITVFPLKLQFGHPCFRPVFGGGPQIATKNMPLNLKQIQGNP